ncbi:MAG: RluA family pseudouridine synthase [Candidatus Paceibacterota bacterium]
MNPIPEILFEDEDIIVISKPPRLNVHGNGRDEEYTLTDWLLEHDPSLVDVGEPLKLEGGKTIPKPGLAHRLDRDTSGVMVIARNQRAYKKLKNQFQEREVEKWYHAIVYGAVKGRYGEIDQPIGRSSVNFKRRTTNPETMRGRMRPAYSEYWVALSAPKASLLKVRPKTGRTHQVRVHCAAIKHPIVCDHLYASHRERLLGFSRSALHAYQITFTHPTSGERVVFTAPYPQDFENAVEALKKEAQTDTST